MVSLPFRRLSGLVGPDSTGWRYDPVFIGGRYSVGRHIEAFARMARALAGFTHTAVISFIDLYAKTRRNFPEARPVAPEERLALGKAFAEIARENGMTLRPCAEGDELAVFGADCRGCMTAAVYEKAIGRRLRIPPGSAPKRECACHLGGDIGAYNSCGHLCRYCYANADEAAVRRNMAAHDPDSPMLIGRPMPGDRVHDAVQESWIDDQIAMEI